MIVDKTPGHRSTLRAVLTTSMLLLCFFVPALSFALTQESHALQNSVDGQEVTLSASTQESHALQNNSDAQVFTAPVTLTQEDGTQKTIDCSFITTGTTTCAVFGSGGPVGSRAVDKLTAGVLEIPSHVTYKNVTYAVVAVDNYAFGGAAQNACSSLTGIILPRTITNIGDYAFANCNKLTSAALPAGVEIIGHHAFYFCSGLTEVIVPASVKTLGSYCFCQCQNLKRVQFKGDATGTGAYAFTGETSIQEVHFYGKALPYNDLMYQALYFNNAETDRPAFYYKVTFYGSAEDASSETNPLGSALVRDDVQYKDITSLINGSNKVGEGRIPAYPDNTNLWRFENSTSLNKTLTDSCSAYSEYSRFRELEYGSATMQNCNYTGEPVQPTLKLYKPNPQNPRMLWQIQPARTLTVFDANGTELDYTTDFTVTYQRKNEEDVWIDTDDLTTPGTIQITIVGTGNYTGTLTVTFDIMLKSGCTFVFDIDCAQGGETTKVPCAFRVDSLGGTSGTVSVVQKMPTKAEEQNKTFLRAIPLETSGTITIPATLNLYGYTFAVTAVDPLAFGTLGEADGVACQGLSGVSLPAGISRMGGGAFGGCDHLKTIEFQGDTEKTSFEASTFLECPLSTVVFKGTRPDDARYSLETLFPHNPRFFYTITFYATKDDYEAKSNPLGSITVRDDVCLAEMPDKPSNPEQVLSGSVPDYPSNLIDDRTHPTRHWYAPSWMYPEVDTDNARALKSCLTNSVGAYAEQMQDAFAIDDAIVYGVNDTYDYTGENVLDAADLTVYRPVGGRLQQGVDYTVSFEREDDDLAWHETEDIKSGGNLRVVIRGLGIYYNQTRFCQERFKILVYEAALNQTFIAPLPLHSSDGPTTVGCTFEVISLGAGRSVCIKGDKTTPAIPLDTTGELRIPTHVEYQGVSYRIAQATEYCFAGCTGLSRVDFAAPLTLTAGMFYGCSGLESLEVPEGNKHLPSSLFADCTHLKRVTLPEGVESITHAVFSGCTSLESINLPTTLRTIYSNSFSQCWALKTVHIPFALTYYSQAFFGTGLETVTFDEGITVIPKSAFGGCAHLSSVSLPEGLTSIEEFAFMGTALKKLVLPESMVSVGKQAFGGCASLESVIFEGDANHLHLADSFIGASAVRTVVYRGEPLRNFVATFPAAPPDCTCYSTLRFYASEDDYRAGLVYGRVTVKHGILLRRIGTTLAPSECFDGVVPELPETANVWRFKDGVPLSQPLSCSMDVVAVWVNNTDLAAGWLVTDTAYRYTSSTIDPFANGTGFVVSAQGDYLTRGIHFTLTYQRQNAEGEWVDTGNKTTRGTLRIVAHAREGSGYTGSVCGFYTITDYLPGDSFSAPDENGNDITYEVITAGTAITPGTVRIGCSNLMEQSTTRAINPRLQGEISLPNEVIDSGGNRFTPVEIAPYAFYRCMGVTKVTIPDSVTYIGEYAFAYKWVKTDVRTSGLETIVFQNDMTQTSVGVNAFLGCDIVKNVIYGQKKGTFEEATPFVLKKGVRLNHYYTARYFASQDKVDASLMATVVVKEGTYLYSPSLSDYLFGSDHIPLPPEEHEWTFEAAAQDEEGRVIDSQDVFATPVVDNTITVDLDYKVDGSSTTLPCKFTVLTNPSDTTHGTVSVGTMRDGQPCVAPAATGTLFIPSQIRYEERVFDVVEVGPFAFGSSDPQGATSHLTEVKLPSSIKNIDDAAFMNCTTLKCADIPEDAQLITVGAAAFSGCKNLTALSLPFTVTTIRAAAFEASGLKRAFLPPSLTILGKRAFDGCENLGEVVFAGPLHLDLPALEGMDASDTPRYSATSNNMSLSVVDDYTFANCSSLKRVVFEANAAHTFVSETAFENSPNISTLVFGGSKTAVVVPNGLPQTYYTVSFFNSTEDKEHLVRAGYLCLAANTVYDTHKAEDIYCGSIPPPVEHHKWVPSFDGAEALTDSGSVCLQKILYSIDTSENDKTFTVAVTVDEKPSEQAAFKDTVTVSISTVSAVQPTGFVVTDPQTGTVVAHSESPTASFSMPGCNIKIDATYACDLVVIAQKPKVTDPVVHMLSINQIEELAQTTSVPLLPAKDSTTAVQEYSAWNAYRESQITRTDEYVDLITLLEAAGVRFDAGDSLIVENRAGDTTSISYNDLYPTTKEGTPDRFFYPHISSAEMRDAQEVQPVIAVRSQTYHPTFENPDEREGMSMKACYRLCYGQRPKDFMELRDTASQQLENICKITVLYGAEDVSSCTLQGLTDEGYYYTGEPIRPNFSLYDIDGELLQEGVDFQAVYGENIDAGYGTITVKGMGLYKGEKEFTFKIRRAEELAGPNREATSARIALAAYPEGSSGVIVASSTSFPDALSASSLAGALGYPILLTSAGGLSPDVADAIDALSAGANEFVVIVVGGPSSVGQPVYDQLAHYVTNENFIVNLAGSDRYATSQAIFDYGKDGRIWSDTGVVATGQGFADALSISAYAAASSAPIVLTDGSSLTEAARQSIIDMGCKRLVLVGGYASVEAEVERQAAELVGAENTERLGGDNRYQTCRSVVDFELSEGLSLDGAALASGESFPDALAGGPLVAKDRAVLLLVGPADGSVLDVLAEHAGTVSRMRFLGGMTMVTHEQRMRALAKLQWSEEALS